MKKKYFLLMFTLLLFTTGFSFADEPAETGEIKGVVTDSKDNKPIEFATVSLHKIQDSSMVTGTVTGIDGSFALDKVPYGTYFLKADFLGYATLVVPKIVVNKKQQLLEGIQLEQDIKNLGVLDVTAERSLIEIRIDKKIFNADQSLVAKGGNGLDLLREVPSVDVDENDNITLRGDENVTILIDGRLSAMPANQLLKQMPASAIEKVEIITNPSAKYDPEGMSGILNIVLKKNKLKGLNGNLNTSLGYGQYGKYNGTLGLNYRSDKINLYASYNNYYGRFGYGGRQDRNVLLGDTLWDRLVSKDDGFYLSRSHYVKGGADLFANDYNTFYVSGVYNNNDGQSTGQVDYENFDEDENVTSSSVRFGDTENPKGSYELNGGWQRSFKKKGAALDLDINYSNNFSESVESLEEQFFNASLVEIGNRAYQFTNQTDENSILLGKLDFTLPINDSTELEMGSHYTVRNSISGFTSESATGSNDFTPDTSLNNTFDYLQSTIAGYATFGRQFKKLGIKLGLRAEQTNTTSELITTNEKFENDYFQLFPSVHFSYKTKNSGEFLLSYSKRINRPRMGMLNPFTSYSDPYTSQIGNPFLKPEIIHVNELGYIKYWKKVTVNSTLYYRIINDQHRRYLYYEGGISTVSFKNLGNSKMGGAELILTYSPIKAIRISSSFTLWAADITDDVITNGERIINMSWSENLSLTLRLKKGLNIQLSGRYRPEFAVQQGVILPSYGASLAIQKSILKKKGNISIRVSDIFNTRQFTFESYDLGNYTFTTERNWESQTAYLSFSYYFGKMTKGKQKRAGKDNQVGDDKSMPGMQ